MSYVEVQALNSTATFVDLPKSNVCFKGGVYINIK